MLLSDTFSFWRAWLRAPRSVGAVVPSGPSLARLMTRHVNHRHGPVIELGPGTGVFTRALLAGGLPTHRLALVEADPVFADALTQRYPEARVLRMDAAQLGETLPLFGDERASAVISGLPLLSMPPEQVAAIIRGVFEQQLHADGALYQFTYGTRCPLPRQLLDQLDLEAVRIGSVLFNLPPATVYRIGRRQCKRVAA
ncbi:phospholipid methyltransferase [Rhodanobacter sp. A1T4]|jgi:phosphatidylethanolamine/phosphatidyl-N-methylethanolamine N-methyltransferase|uniref:class I SAM-dependent methyltransferase n=1 Tax=Rhodanobacter sp. A1T4 TaxID=2723087 RepID=UPI00161EC62C|nr:phospholipid methyltransferase [Rhodanobacter sp. A1T4]